MEMTPADSLPEHRLLGFGTTKREAVEDLMRISEDYPDRTETCQQWLTQTHNE